MILVQFEQSKQFRANGRRKGVFLFTFIARAKLCDRKEYGYSSLSHNLVLELNKNPNSR